MGRSLWKASHRGDEIIAFQPLYFLGVFPDDQFGEGRAAGDGGDTPFCLEADFMNPSRIHFQADADHVATDWIFDLSACVSIGKIASVSGILKMIK